MTTVCILLLHRKLNKTPTTATQLHIVNSLIFCTSNEHDMDTLNAINNRVQH